MSVGLNDGRKLCPQCGQLGTNHLMLPQCDECVNKSARGELEALLGPKWGHGILFGYLIVRPEWMVTICE